MTATIITTLLAPAPKPKLASITITLTDTPNGAVALHSSFVPGVGKPCSPAQSTALDIIARHQREWGSVQTSALALTHARLDAPPPPMAMPAEGVDMDRIHQLRDGVVPAEVREVSP